MEERRKEGYLNYLEERRTYYKISLEVRKNLFIKIENQVSSSVKEEMKKDLIHVEEMITKIENKIKEVEENNMKEKEAKKYFKKKEKN